MMTDTVKVYHFRGWNQREGANVVPPKKATAAFIESHGYERIEGSGEDVPSATVDADGRLRV